MILVINCLGTESLKVIFTIDQIKHQIKWNSFKPNLFGEDNICVRNRQVFGLYGFY